MAAIEDGSGLRRILRGTDDHQRQERTFEDNGQAEPTEGRSIDSVAMAATTRTPEPRAIQSTKRTDPSITSCGESCSSQRRPVGARTKRWSGVEQVVNQTKERRRAKIVAKRGAKSATRRSMVQFGVHEFQNGGRKRSLEFVNDPGQSGDSFAKMPSTKDTLLKQAQECRRRVEFLMDIRRDVDSCVDKACGRILNEVEKAENGAPAAGVEELKRMIAVLRNARKVVKEYEESFEQILTLHEEGDLDLNESQSCLGNVLTPIRLHQGQKTAVVGSHSLETVAAAGSDLIDMDGVISTNPLAGDKPADPVAVDVPDSTSLAPRDSTAVAPPDSAAVNGPTESTVSIINGPSVVAEAVTPAIVTGPDSTVADSPNLAAAVADGDYLSHVVGKGTGPLEDPCQRSIALDASRADKLTCTISEGHSPSLFWVYPTTRNMSQIEADMDMYADWKALSNPMVGDYCVAPYQNVDILRRAKILEMKDNASGTPFAKLLYLDFGIVDWVAVAALLDFPSRFRHYPRQACPCALADVEPVSLSWSEGAVSTFLGLCESAPGLAIQLLDSQDTSPGISTIALFRKREGDQEHYDPFLISFIPSSKGAVRRSNRSVPMKLFEKEGCELIGGRDPPDVNDGWRCFVRTLEDTEPPANADDIVAQETTGGISRAAARAAMTERRAATNSITQGQIRQRQLQEAVNHDGSLYCVVMRIVSPSEFYIQLRDTACKNGALDQLTMDLNSFYSVPANRCVLRKFDGHQAAVIRYPVDGESAYRRIIVSDWQFPTGAGTRDIRTWSSVNVIFVDLGFCRRLQTGDIFILDKRFCDLPAQSAYCKLYECLPNTPDGRWQQSACDIFISLCTREKLMKATVMSERQPYDLVVTRCEDNSCLNVRMLETNLARSDVEWNID